MVKFKGSLLTNGFVLSAFACLAVAGVLLNIKEETFTILGKTLHTRITGMGFITIGVILYFIGRVMGALKKIRKRRDMRRTGGVF